MKRLTSPTMGLLMLSILHAACGGTGNDDGTRAASATGGKASSTGGKSSNTGGKSSNAGGKSSSTGGAQADTAGRAGDEVATGGRTPDEGTAGAPSGETPDSSDPGAGGAPGTPDTTPPDTTPPPDLDADDDGVSDALDLCPDTRVGTSVTVSGCDAASDAGAQIPWGQPVPQSAERPVPTTGSVEENGFMNIVVDAGGRFPLVFRAHTSNVETLASGFHVTGALLLDVPGATLPLTEVDVTFEYGANEADGIKTLRGTSRVPFPDFGAPDSVVLDAPIAEIGLEEGKNLHDLKAPIVDDRRYLFFNFSDELSASVGPMTVELPAAVKHTLILDHTDPMFFVRGGLSGLPGMPVEIEDAGIGFSRQGRLPFTPTHTWGTTSANASGFSGQMYLEMKGGVAIPETPILLTSEGVSVLDLDPARTGRTVFSDPENGLRVGANRSLGVGLELIPSVADIEMTMGEASLDLSLMKDSKTAFISGVMYPGKSFFNDVVPILPGAQVKVAAAIANPVSDSRFAMAGDVSIALSKLGALTGLSLSDVPLAQAILSVDKSGVSIHGNAGAALLPALGIGGGATFDALFPGSASASAWYVDMKGDLSVSGVHLSGSSNAHLDRSGIALSGRLNTALGGIGMLGRIDSQGVNVQGSANVTIPIVAGRTEIKTLVNGAVCGYQQVRDGALCGFETLKGFAECSVNYVDRCVVHHHCEKPTCLGPAKSCPDPRQPLACPQAVTIPDFNYGTFTGSVQVAIGSSGLSSALVGRYCAVDGSCQTLPSTSVDLSSSQACVQVPGLSQRFCAAF